MRALRLSRDQPVHERAANLAARLLRDRRRATSRSTASTRSNATDPSSSPASRPSWSRSDQLLRSFVAQGRMKFTGDRIHALLPTRGMNDPQRIRYRFDLPDGSQKFLDFSFDAADFPPVPTRRRPSRRSGPN